MRLAAYMYNIRHAGRYNILVMNTALERYFTPQGIIERIQVDYDSCKERDILQYEIVVFESGYLVNLGDGGYINWCFEGNFDRSGETVTFSLPSETQKYMPA